MKNVHIDFEGNNIKCSAEVDLDGISDSWTAHAKVNGHRIIKELYITYRLGDYLKPLFVSKSDLQFFTPLLYKIDEEAKILLLKEYAEDFETIDK
jgi:hypothetical protein